LKDFKESKIIWKDCWLPYNEEDNVEYYSSTLIIPMSILQEKSDEPYFIEHFFNNVSHSKDLRTIWGFYVLIIKM